VGLLELPWRASAADLDEPDYLVSDPLLSALSVALAKARAVAATSAEDEIVLAADTLVVSDNTVLGKPADAAAARHMLEALRGRAHQVLTGVALLRASDGLAWGGVVSTHVLMREYAEAEIEAYVARGEPLDKAGGYAVQDEQLRPAERLEGCYLNVVGLPLCAVASGLSSLGLAVSLGGPPPCAYCQAGAPLVSIQPSS
jgi:septum formation protein